MPSFLEWEQKKLLYEEMKTFYSIFNIFDIIQPTVCGFKTNWK